MEALYYIFLVPLNGAVSGGAIYLLNYLLQIKAS